MSDQTPASGDSDHPRACNSDSDQGPTSSTGEFSRWNSRLLGIGYRMLGSWSEAEEIAAQTWLRWQERRPDRLDNPLGWLTTVATRLSLDRWRTARRQRETYIGPWLPEPIDPGMLPDESAEQQASLAYGLMQLMERLGPEERAVYVLRHAFDHTYPEIGQMLGRTTDSCRQLGHRAQKKLRGIEGFGVAEQQLSLLQALAEAIGTGAIARAVALLTDDAVLITDGGGQVKSALRPIHGRDKIVRFLAGIVAKAPSLDFDLVQVNGGIGFLFAADSPRLVRVEVVDGRIGAVQIIGNTDKLGHLSVLPPPPTGRTDYS